MITEIYEPTMYTFLCHENQQTIYSAIDEFNSKPIS